MVCLAITTVNIAIGGGTGTVLFRADFENAKGDNDLAKWVPDNKGQIWKVEDFPGGGKGLNQTVEGSGISGNTPLPGTEEFSDGIIQMDMSWRDDDSWGIILRQSAADKGYLVVFGYNETPAVIVALLGEGCAETGKCLDVTACENGGKELVRKEHSLFKIGDD